MICHYYLLLIDSYGRICGMRILGFFRIILHDVHPYIFMFSLKNDTIRYILGYFILSLKFG